MGQHHRLYAGWRGQQIRAELARTLPAPCELCGEMIEPDMPWQVDHIVPVSVAPDRVLDRDNVRPSHPQCNRRRGHSLAPDPDKCVRGHDLSDPANVYVPPSRGGRYCRVCKSLAAKQRVRVKPTVPRAPRKSILERGECKRGHPIRSEADTYRDSKGSQLCRECRREHNRADKARARSGKPPAIQGRTLVQRGECRNGHLIKSLDDVYTRKDGGRDRQTCKACHRAATGATQDRTPVE